MEAAEFLKSYWQKQPCLIRQAQQDFQSFISKKELFDLACREEVESRLVVEAGAEIPWQVTHGPFFPEEFEGLPESHWTLLVQNTNLHLPAATGFLGLFGFIPNWRIDDLMISYAPQYGSVGPHIDSYDVFLFQAIGKRSWSTNSFEYDEDDFIEGIDLRIIESFNAEQEWILEPGDMLYLPPNVAHHGIALEECMTFSIGFRAPSRHELVSHYLDDFLNSETDQRYIDPNLTVPEHSGEISKNHLHEVAALANKITPNEKDFEKWFGRFITRLPDNCEPSVAPLQLNTRSFLKACQNAQTIFKSSSSRTAFIRENDSVLLYVNGHAYELPLGLEKFVYEFSEKYEIENPVLNQGMVEDELAQLLCTLYNLGIITI